MATAQATTRMLPIPLTDDERAIKAQELAKRLGDYDALEEEKKERTKDLAEAMKKARTEFTKLRREVASGKTERLVDCFTEPNLERKCWVVMRADTGECVEDYAMTAKEIDEARQVDFTRKTRPRSDRAEDSEA